MTDGTEIYQATSPLVVFLLDDRRFALPLDIIERAFRAVEILPLPKAPEIVLGIINVRGRIVPVVDVRQRFGLPEKALALTNHMLMAHTGTRPLAILADAVDGVADCRRENLIPADAVVSGTEYVKGVAKLADGLVLVHDLAGFLSLDEERGLAQALADRGTADA